MDKNKDAFLQVCQELPEEGTFQFNENSKIYQVWIQNGGSPAEYKRRFRLQRPISCDYELKLLNLVGVNLAKDHVFLRQVRAVIGESAFLSCLSETKGNAIEPSFQVRKNLSSLLGGRLMGAVSLAARSSKQKSI